MPGYGGFGGASRRENEIQRIMSPKRPSKATHTPKDTKKMAGENRRENQPITPASRHETTRQTDAAALPTPPEATPAGTNFFESAQTPGGANGGFGGSFPTVNDVDFGGSSYTGFANRYNPVTGPSLLYGPGGGNILAQDILAEMGFDNPNAGMLPFLGDYLSAFPYLALLQAGGQVPTDNAMINFGAQFGQGGLQSGGAGVDTQAMMTALNQILSDPSSPLAQSLASMSFNDQVNLIGDILSSATMGVHPIFQEGLQNQLSQQAQQYIQGLAHGDISATGAGALPFTSYIGQQGVGF